MNIPADFHFLRPFWLLALLVLPFIPFLKPAAVEKTNPWYKIADYTLLKSLLASVLKMKNSRLPFYLLVFSWMIAIIALAGPTWEKKEYPASNMKDNYIILVDLSVHMLGQDIKPSRGERLKFKLIDILDRIGTQNVAVILYDDNPYMLTSFTDDINIIKHYVPLLEPRIMPTGGANLENALKKAREISEGYSNVHFLLLTAGNDRNMEQLETQAKTIAAKGDRISIIAMGTEEGSPIPSTNSGFLRDDVGQVLISKPNRRALEQLASMTGGVFSMITVDDSDLRHILPEKPSGQEKNDRQETVSQWRDMGVYLVFLLIIPALLLFRKGFVLILFLAIFPCRAWAFDWDTLLLNDNRQALKLLPKNPEQAAEKFTDKKWKGIARYRAGQYDQSAQDFSEIKDLYNLGNALAYQGNIEGAIAAYEKLLETSPDHADAKYNWDYLKKMQKNQQQQERKQQQSQDNNKDDSSQETSTQKEQSEETPEIDQQQEDVSSSRQDSQNEQVSSDHDSNNLLKEPSDITRQRKLDKVEKDPYGLLRRKLRLIYEKEYNTDKR